MKHKFFKRCLPCCSPLSRVLRAGLVLGAAWLDKDVTLAVGQLLVTALALPLTRERGRRRP